MALEAWVGVTLVDRSRQPVRLTPAGSQMLETGVQALDRVEQERSLLLEAQSLPDKYVVTFGAQHSIGWRFYPTWLQNFEETYGPILSRLRADDLLNCLSDLQNGDVDFVIAYESQHVRYCGPSGAQPRGSRDTLEALTIGRDSLVPVSKPTPYGTPLFDLDTSSLEAPFLQFGNEAPIGQHLMFLFQEEQLSERLRTVYENAMAGALRIRARDGLGIAWLPKSLVLSDLKSGALVQTGKSNWEVPLDIRLFRHKMRTNRLTRSIWSFVEDSRGQSLSADLQP